MTFMRVKRVKNIRSSCVYAHLHPCIFFPTCRRFPLPEPLTRCGTTRPSTCSTTGAECCSAPRSRRPPPHATSRLSRTRCDYANWNIFSDTGLMSSSMPRCVCFLSGSKGKVRLISPPSSLIGLVHKLICWLSMHLSDTRSLSLSLSLPLYLARSRSRSLSMKLLITIFNRLCQPFHFVVRQICFVEWVIINRFGVLRFGDVCPFYCFASLLTRIRAVDRIPSVQKLYWYPLLERGGKASPMNRRPMSKPPQFIWLFIYCQQSCKI